MEISKADLIDFAEACLTSSGASPGNAKAICRVCLDGQLREVDGQDGFGSLDLFCQELLSADAQGEAVAGKAAPEILTETSAAALVHGRWCMSDVWGRRRRRSV